MDKMKIEIWSDIACPYCYIGKRKLETALKQFPQADKVQIVWHSYELNPDLPKGSLGISYLSYMAQQHGVDEAEQRKQLDALTALAKSVGLDYNLDALVVTNTSDALRLVKLARRFDLADETEEVLFKAYFTDGKCVSDKDTLIALGMGVGLPKEEIVKMLLSNDFQDEIKEDIRYSENVLDLEYIPFYLINNQEIIQGSLDQSEYLPVLSRAYSYWEKNGPGMVGNNRTNGSACSIDGVCSL